MATQIFYAKKKKMTAELLAAARSERIDPKKLLKSVAKGHTIITKNIKHKIEPIAIGSLVSVKINANIGTSKAFNNAEEEFEKAKVAVKYGSDTIMDLSTAGNLNEMRSNLLEKIPVPLGTVPIYDICQKKSFLDATEDEIIGVFLSHMKLGIDFITVHAGITKNVAEKYSKKGRLAGIVSRGGALLYQWMLHNKRENPLYSNFDSILQTANELDVVLSLGDALRPGSLNDAGDYFQIAELKTLGKLVEIARKNNVQCIVEGPGHVPINKIAEQMKLEKKYCHHAPFYVLGPLVTDLGAGYDHITAAIGGAIAAMNGADFLCYVTPSEHLGLPSIEDVRAGTVATKIAAHAVNLTRFPHLAKRDHAVSKERFDLNWKKQFELLLDGEKAQEIYCSKKSSLDSCTMCADLCPMKLSKIKK